MHCAAPLGVGGPPHLTASSIGSLKQLYSEVNCPYSSKSLFLVAGAAVQEGSCLGAHTKLNQSATTFSLYYHYTMKL